MLNRLLISAAVSALMVSGAMAQANPPPAKSPPASPPAAQESGKFVAAQGTDQWVFSRFKGTDVLGPDNAHIGDVNDLLFDKQGKIIAIVVGVGGFLGIGEKNVAIDMGSFQVVPADTGSKDTTGRANPSDPTDIKLKVSWTKDQLKSAPDFKYYQAVSSRAPTGGPPPRPMTPPPQQR
jgi:hypothetical protein